MAAPPHYILGFAFGHCTNVLQVGILSKRGALMLVQNLLNKNVYGEEGCIPAPLGSTALSQSTTAEAPRNYWLLG